VKGDVANMKRDIQHINRDTRQMNEAAVYSAALSPKIRASIFDQN